MNSLSTAWLYAVIAPMLPRLAVEQDYLERRNPGWRFRARRCEFVRPLHEYVPSDHEPTLRQLLRCHRDVARPAGNHDTAVKDIENLAGECHSLLVKKAGLEALSAVLERELPGWRGAYPPGDGPGLLAEHTINWAQAETIPPEYSSSKAWARYRTHLLDLTGSGALGKRFANLRHEIESLGSITRDLREAIEAFRDGYADRFGIPPFPLHPPGERLTL